MHLLHLRVVPPPFFAQRFGARAIAGTIPTRVDELSQTLQCKDKRSFAKLTVCSRGSCFGKQGVALLRVRYGLVSS